jgi:hypothetical protein
MDQGVPFTRLSYHNIIVGRMRSFNGGQEVLRHDKKNSQ